MTERRRRVPLSLRAPSLRLFLLAAGVVPVLLLALMAWLGAELAQSEAMRIAAERSADRRAARLALLSRLTDAETAQRGYLLTGDAAFLDAYEPARAGAARYVATHPADRVVAPLVAAKFAELDRTLSLFRQGDRRGARDVVIRGSGRRLMTRLRAELGRMIAADERRYAMQRAAYRRDRDRLREMLGAGGALLMTVVVVGLFHLWRLRRQRHAALMDAFEAAERNATILDSTTDALLILNPSGTVESMNAAASRMLGHTSAEIERRDIGTIIDLAPGHGSFHQRIGLVDGQLRRAFFPDRMVRHRNGREVMVDVAIGVMHLPSGIHLVMSLRDISERKRIDRVKDELMSTISHELRTPLTSIVGSLGLLRAGAAGELPSGPARLIEIAENNSRRLIRLVNDMLDIDRIESGRLKLTRERIDLRALLDRACEGSEGLARAADVTLDCRRPDAPVIVTGDADRLLQVATNLLSNAIRVAPAGSRVGLTLSIGDGRAIFAVEDRGGGIPAAFRDRIFGRFERAPSQEEGTGTGLGLAISREIVARHGGSIWFEDRAGGGTRFVFALPLPSCADRSPSGGATVLVCEADDDAARALVGLVTQEGCGYDLVRSMAEASEAVARHGYRAILLGRSFGPPNELVAAASPIVVAGDSQAEATRALRAALAQGAAVRPVILHLDDDRDVLAVVAAALEPEMRVMGAADLSGARALLHLATPDVAVLDMTLAHGVGLDLLPLLTDAQGAPIPAIVYSAQEVAPRVAGQVAAVVTKGSDTLPDLKATIRRLLHEKEEVQP